LWVSRRVRIPIGERFRKSSVADAPRDLDRRTHSKVLRRLFRMRDENAFGLLTQYAVHPKAELHDISMPQR